MTSFDDEADASPKSSGGASSSPSSDSSSPRHSSQNTAGMLVEDFGRVAPSSSSESPTKVAAAAAPQAAASASAAGATFNTTTLPPQTRSTRNKSDGASSSSSSSSNNNNSTTPSSAIPSFTSDSPYLQSYIDRDMRNLVVLTETLRDISGRARTFGKCGALMAEATRRLSSACRLNPPNPPANNSGGGETVGGSFSDENDEQMRVMKERQESIGDEMTSVLTVLGEILDEVADAQVSMCQSLEASLSLSLEAFAGVELNEATRLRSEADVMSENAEGSFSRYMHGRHTERANMVGGMGGDGIGTSMTMDALDQQNFVTSWNKLSDHVGSQFKSWNRSASMESSGHNSSGSGDGGNDQGGLTTGKEPGRRLKNLRDRINRGKDDEHEKDPALATAEAAANLRHNLEQIRLTQANAELKRFQLLRRLDSIKTRRNFELGESTLASLNGLRAYFHHCSDMIDGITPKLTRLQDTQAQSREKHDAQQAPWETKQKSLTNAIGEVGAAAANAGAIADAISKGQVEDLDEHILSGHPLTLEMIESNVRLWELQRQLNIGSLYQRKPTAGVIVEGWLYKKSSNRLSLNQWARRWFILDKKGVYYLKGGGDGKKGDNSNGIGPNDWMERIKICDILLCTVREINCKAKGNPNLRFCFEIISPNSKSYLLQACGPEDFKMWVSGIRTCIEQQLVHGKLPPENMLLGSGKHSKSKKGRRGKRIETESITYEEDDDDNVIVDRRTSSGELFEGDFPNGKSPSPSPSGIRNPLVPRILEANSVCADCGNLDPDWASLNLGVVVCIECSGVHRSLGVHVSKVRSLRLDEMREHEYNLLLELGNDKVNCIWEAGLHHQKGWTKPKGNAPRKAKEEWIKSKYVWKGFLEYRAEDGREQEDREAKFNRDLFEGARRGDLLAIQEALAKGGNVEWKNEREGGKTALHICVVGQPLDENDLESWKGIQCAELLIQNGSKVDVEDFDHHKALDCAVVGNGRREMIEYLSTRNKT
ncbi:hypothetical protein ACHAXR_013522 [Thalassiosira sp. AJA248-18]